MAHRDLYAALGVGRGASPEQIKRAYRRLAKRLHPDIDPSPEAHERFLAVKEAYEVLSNPLLRREYDEKYDRLARWAPPPSEAVPSRVIRVQAPFVPRGPRGIRVVRTAETRRRRQILFVYTAVATGSSVAFLAGAFLLVAAGGTVPGVLSFVTGLALALVVFHVLPSARAR